MTTFVSENSCNTATFDETGYVLDMLDEDTFDQMVNRLSDLLEL
jgi:hypothetical protein